MALADGQADLSVFTALTIVIIAISVTVQFSDVNAGLK